MFVIDFFRCVHTRPSYARSLSIFGCSIFHDPSAVHYVILDSELGTRHFRSVSPKLVGYILEKQNQNRFALQEQTKETLV